MAESMDIITSQEEALTLEPFRDNDHSLETSQDSKLVRILRRVTRIISMAWLSLVLTFLSGLVKTLNRLGSMSPPSGPPFTPQNPDDTPHIFRFPIKNWVEEKDHHEKEKKEQEKT